MHVTSIADRLFFSTVRIDTISATGLQGSGTGFLFAKRSSDGNATPFVVTNKHVVKGMREGSITFLHKHADAPVLGRATRTHIDASTWDDAWFGHPSPDVDIAICPYYPLQEQLKTMGVDIYYQFISDDLIPSPEVESTLDSIENVTFVGYPNGIWDTVNLLPVARRGSTASPISVYFENKPSFVIDASVFGGSSGSPVFIVNQGVITDKLGSTTIGSRVLFVGVVAAVFFRLETNQVISIPIPTATVPAVNSREMLDLGIVFKARTVVETIDALFKARASHSAP